MTHYIIAIYWHETQEGYGLCVVNRTHAMKNKKGVHPIVTLDAYDLEDVQDSLEQLWDRSEALPAYVEVVYYDENDDEYTDHGNMVAIPYTLQSYYKNKYFPRLKLSKNEVMYDIKRRQVG